MSRAVIADDEPLMREQLRERLTELWPELDIVAEAKNGAEAVDMVSAHRPEVVFLDIRMPAKSGIEAARAARREARAARAPRLDPGLGRQPDPDDPGRRRAVLRLRREIHPRADGEAGSAHPQVHQGIDRRARSGAVLADPPLHPHQRARHRRHHARRARAAAREHQRPTGEAGSQPQLRPLVQRHVTRGSGLALMLAAPLLWSTAGVVTRHIERASPFELVFWRSFFAFLFVALALLIMRRNPLRIGWPGLLSGALWAVMFTAFMIALTLTSTANTLVVMSISPLLTTILASLVLRDPVPLGTWIAAGAAALGIAWMFGSDLNAHTARDLAGMLIALAIPIAAAINVVTLRAVAAELDLRPAVMLGGAISCLIALPLALPLQATPMDIALLAFLGVFQLGLPCMLLVLASRVLLAPEIALLGLLEVVLGPLWAWLGAGEVPARATVTGGAIVLLALISNELAGIRPERSAA